MSEAPESVKKYLAAIGKKGGASGQGESKTRGDADYYKKISALAAEGRKKKQAEKKAAQAAEPEAPKRKRGRPRKDAGDV